MVGAARAVIVPIWEGGGTRLKVLEALAAGRERGLDAARARPASASSTGATACWPRRREALATALAGVLGQPSTHGREGRILAERFRWKEALSGASAFYSEVVARARFAR